MVELSCAYSNVYSLDGLQFATELEYLDITGNLIEDLGPLAGHPALNELLADDLPLASLDPLAGMASLEVLSVSNSTLTDVDALASTGALSVLDVSRNHLFDLSPLMNLASLQLLNADGQELDLGPTATCSAIDLTGAYDHYGEPVAFAVPSWARGYVWGEMAVFPWAGSQALSFASTDGVFSGYAHASVSGVSGQCPFSSSGAVTVTGVADVGKTLTANTGSSVPAAEHTSVSWYDSSSNYLGYGASLKLTEPMLGKTIHAEAVTSLPGFADTTKSSAAVKVYGLLAPSVKTAKYGTPMVGKDLSVSATAAPHPVTEKCQWLRSGIAITGATSCTYRVTSSDLDKSVSVRLTISKPAYRDYVIILDFGKGLRSFGTFQTAPKISGTLDVGKTLTTSAGTFAITPTSTTFQWTRDGVAISGATAKSYTLVSADAGKRIAVTLKPVRSGYYSLSYSASAVSVHRFFTTAPVPKVTGTPTVGYTLSLSRGTWSPSATTYSYQWYRDSTKISGATMTTYKAQTADAGHKITVAVTSRKSGYTTTTRHSVAVSIGKKLTSAPTPTVSGTAKVGSTLTGKVGTWGPGTVTKKYQWYVNGAAVAGATGTTFKVRPQDAYKKVTFKVSASKSGYTSTSRTSASTTPVGIKYLNCTEMRKHYPGGVAKSSSVKDIQNGVVGGKILTSTYVSASLYTLNAGSDRDQDGWACEP